MDIFNRKFSNEHEVKVFLDSIRNKKLIATNTDELFESTVGNKLANIFFRPYTKKMWGIESKKLSINIGARLPVRTNKDTRYFEDNFQALPKYGYTRMIKNMLDHKNISLNLNTNFQKGMEKDYFHTFICVPIDLFYNYVFGKLPYRSIIFETRKEFGDDLSSPAINFTDNSKYTRKTQWNLFPNSPNPKNNYNSITYEIPCQIENNPGEYYYPIQTKESKKIYEKYKKLSSNEKLITFCGRTGLFKYIDMIPAVMIHMRLAKKFISLNK